MLDIKLSNKNAVKKYIEFYIKETDNLTKVWPYVHNEFLKVEKKIFETEGWYGGFTLPEYKSESYKRWKQKKNLPKLVVTKRLKRSATNKRVKDHHFIYSKNQLSVYTKVPYAVSLKHRGWRFSGVTQDIAKRLLQVFGQGFHNEIAKIKTRRI